MKLVGDMSKACKDIVDARNLSSSKGGWTNAWKRNPQATRPKNKIKNATTSNSGVP